MGMDIIEKYNKTAVQYAQSRIGAEDKAELEKFKSLLRPGDKVLDVGCAAGRDTYILKSMGFDAVGSDLAEKLLDIARTTHPDIAFVLADMRQMPFDDHTFQGIWASAVLHHLPKPEMAKALAEFARLLTPGGILYLHTKAGTGRLRTQEQIVEGEEREFELTTPQDLDEMLNQAGLTKLSLDVTPSKSRPNLSWATAFYKK